MSRTINEIQNEILTARDAVAELNALEVLTTSEQTILQANTTSKVGVWRRWLWVVAFAIYTFEQILNVFKKETDDKIAKSRPHTAKWYRQKAMDFLYGVPLVTDADYYDTSLLTEAQIAAAKIISNAATVRVLQNGYGTLRIKVVRTVSTEYAPVTTQHLFALNNYFNNHVADAGTIVLCTTGEADMLKLKLDIYYDALLLDPQGGRLDGSATTPVIDAIKAYLKSIDFENGQFITTRLVDALQKVPGVILPVVREAYSKYGTYDYTETTIPNVGLINEIRPADSGYMKLDEPELLINYIVFKE
jgi:NADH:ubiquinone oxidoreductase subunit 5 (subunit L)/multisubunit Na+/H+ antiporter MnhA subunit